MKAIGVKMVDLQPMTVKEAVEKGYKVNNYHPDYIGYEVTYPDGYKSWCPKDVADKAYYKIQDGNGEKLYREDINNFISYSQITKIGTKTTNITLTTITGFEVNGQSSCVNAENYDLSIGAQYARPKAEDLIWFGLGFVLQWARNGLHSQDEFAIDPNKQ